MRIDGKLLNQDGELVASGPCEFNADKGEVTMWPAWELHMLERERGELKLLLDDGRSLDISRRHLTFKLRGTGEQRTTVYRLRIVERVPDHLRDGYVEPAGADDAPQPASREPAAEPAPRQP